MRSADLSPRLRSAASFVRLGAVFADVGTDHAYLPLFLLEKGIVKRVVCSDINRGPLDSAVANAKERGFFDSMDFILTDGAAALEGRGITDLAICGMGGELISDIIEAAPFLKDGRINLILQPMSKQAHLRKYLASRGFCIEEEKYSCEAHRNYVTIKANFVGEALKITELEAEIGNPPYSFSSDEPRKRYALERLSALKRAQSGKLRGGRALSDETELIRELEELLT